MGTSHSQRIGQAKSKSLPHRVRSSSSITQEITRSTLQSRKTLNSLNSTNSPNTALTSSLEHRKSLITDNEKPKPKKRVSFEENYSIQPRSKSESNIELSNKSKLQVPDRFQFQKNQYYDPQEVWKPKQRNIEVHESKVKRQIRVPYFGQKQPLPEKIQAVPDKIQALPKKTVNQYQVTQEKELKKIFATKIQPKFYQKDLYQKTILNRMKKGKLKSRKSEVGNPETIKHNQNQFGSLYR